MTKFLNQAAMHSGDDVNGETERMFAYHHATKHTFDSVRMNAHFLDWRNQPNPFRVYEGTRLISLAPDPGFPDARAFAMMAALGDESGTAESREEVALDAEWLSRLLWHSMAVSAWKRVPRTEDRYSLRVNPSSGNLHPTEAHIATRGFAGVEDGLYHYRADRHALEMRGGGDWTRSIAQALELPWAADAPLVVALTSIFWREAWKYRDRAYRYCCHDLGHAMLSVLLAARALGVDGGVVGSFGDVRLARALGLTEESDEAPMAVLIFPRTMKSGREARAVTAPPRHDVVGIPNELSAEEIRYDLLLGMHRSTLLSGVADESAADGNAAMLDKQTAPSKAEGAAPSELGLRQEPGRDAALAATVRRRRSALDFDPATELMERGDFEQLLDFATRDWRADWRGNFADDAGAGSQGETEAAPRDGGLVDLYIYVHRVRDCAPGVYRWHARSCALEELHRGDVRRVAEFLSLEQSLAGNACFAISMIGNLQRAARAFGNRGYRYAFFEAGAIGQRLYVGAEALGWNATGIGAFYDDDVHRYLGFLGDDESIDPRTLPRQVIYHFAVGRAIHDPRIEA